MKSCLAVSTLLAGLVAAPTAPAQLFELSERVDLLQIDPATSNGRLGREMAAGLDGRVLLVAAPFKEDDGDPGSQDGTVYSFDVAMDGTLTLAQTLEPPVRFQFGANLDVDGDWAAISSSTWIYLYQYNGSVWQLRQQLELDADVPPTPGVTLRGLRSSIALSGNLLVVGDISANVEAGGSTISNAGAVVLFRRGGNGQWNHEATLTASQPSGAADFGDRVAVHGDVLLVGAPEDRVAGVNVGGAYLFQKTGSSWSLRRTLRNPDPGSAEFGWSVAVEGNIALVGCATCSDFPDGPSNTGSFFTFERSLGGVDNWGLVGETVGSRPQFIDNFSISLALRDGMLLVGATGTNPNAASVFSLRGDGSWRELEFLESGEATNTEYGNSVALAPGRAFVGASIWPNSSSSERWGAVYSWYSPLLLACRGQLEPIFCAGFEDLAQPRPAAPR